MEKSQAAILKEAKERRQLENCVAEKTGYRAKVYFVKNKEVEEEYEIHITDNDQDWKYISVPLDDVDVAYSDFMYSLLHLPKEFKSYNMGKHGALLKTALNIHGLSDLGYTIAYGELMAYGTFDGEECKVESL